MLSQPIAKLIINWFSTCRSIVIFRVLIWADCDAWHVATSGDNAATRSDDLPSRHPHCTGHLRCTFVASEMVDGLLHPGISHRRRDEWTAVNQTSLTHVIEWNILFALCRISLIFFICEMPYPIHLFDLKSTKLERKLKKNQLNRIKIKIENKSFETLAARDIRRHKTSCDTMRHKAHDIWI